MERLRKISGILRIFVLIAITAIVGYLLYGYVIENKLYTDTSALYLELWKNTSISQSLLIAFKAPSFLAFLWGIFWLQKLLAYYQQGEFFGQEAMRCYIWLIWLKLMGLLLGVIETLSVGFYYDSVLGDADINLSIDFGAITTTLLMLIIVYLLKAAKEIEAENKEFI